MEYGWIRERGSGSERTTGEFPKLSRYPFSLIKWRRLASSSGRGRFYLYPRGVLNKYTRFYTKKSSKIVNWSGVFSLYL